MLGPNATVKHVTLHDVIQSLNPFIGHAKSDRKVRDGVSSDDGDQRRDLDDQLKRMERDNNRKQQELLLQAENAFKMQEEAYNVELVRLKTGVITSE